MQRHFGESTALARRQFLTSAASGLGLAATASLLVRDGLLAAEPGANQSAPASSPSSNPLAVKPTHFAPRADRCIFIFLIGGVSHIDLFDAKPALNKLDGKPIPDSFREGIRLGQTNWSHPLMGCKFPFRRYGACGLEMSELLPQLGTVADELAVIRSMHHSAFDHAPGELMTNAGKDIPGRPSLGAWLNYGLGSESENLPGYVVMVNGRGPKARDGFWTSGFLPASYQGVLFRPEGSPILNLRNPDGLSPEFHKSQLDAIGRLDRLQLARNQDPAIQARIAAYELAFRMQTAGPELTDLAREPAVVVKSYGDSNFARSLLLARRLVERGVRFVTVTHHEWDNHDGINNALPSACRHVDGPIAALIKDLKSRGMLERTLVVGGTEFGRTAITQGSTKNPGRDHHPHAYTMFLAGGGVPGGQVIGESDEIGWRATKDAVHINDFHATLLHLFGLDHERLTYRHQGNQVRLTDVAGKLVPQLIS